MEQVAPIRLDKSCAFDVKTADVRRSGREEIWKKNTIQAGQSC